MVFYYRRSRIYGELLRRNRIYSELLWKGQDLR